jgi:hypothetical protein
MRYAVGMDTLALIKELENQVEKINKKLIRTRFLNVYNRYIRIAFYEHKNGFLRFNSSFYVDPNESGKIIVDSVLIKPTYNEHPIRVSLSYLGKYKEESLYPVRNNKYYTGYTRIAKFLVSLENPSKLSCLLFKNFWIFVNSEELETIKTNLLHKGYEANNFELFCDINRCVNMSEFKYTNAIEITTYLETTLEEIF